MPPLDADPVLVEITKAIYGDDVDVRDVLGKFAPGGPDLHIDGPITPQQQKRNKQLAAIGLGATTIAGIGGLHALKTTGGEIVDRLAAAGHPKAQAMKAAREAKLATKGPGKVAGALKAVGVKPTTAAAAIGGGWAALHGVELLSDSLAARAQVKAYNQANQPPNPADKNNITKALRLRPLNPSGVLRPSLRAKRPKATPLTGGPAGAHGLFKAADDVTWTGEIAKVDEDKRQVFGWASVSAINGEPVVDLQGDIVPIEEIEKSAYQYVLQSRKGGDMHSRVSKSVNTEPLHTADMIESFVVTPEKLEKMGLAPDALPHGWWIGFHVNDDHQWNLVKSKERTGFSIHGTGIRTPVEKSLQDVKDRARAKVTTIKGNLRTRVDQAKNPPKVKLTPVDSSAIKEMGYQKQTRRLAYRMYSEPGKTYTYRARPAKGQAAMSASSKGRFYATQVRGKTQRTDGDVTPADRARLFLNPVRKAAPVATKPAAPVPATAGSPPARATMPAASAGVTPPGASTLKPLPGPTGTTRLTLKPVTPIKAAAKPMAKRDYTAQQRRDLQARGMAMPGGKYPVVDETDLHNAWALRGHGGPSVVTYLRRRAHQLGVTLPDDDVSKATNDNTGDIPGDNPRARLARQREKTGLGLAGVGYLSASRGKDVAGGMADLVTRSPKTLGTKAHKATVLAREKRISRVTSRGGAAGVLAGLAIAGEGLATDWRQRKVIPRAKERTGQFIAAHRHPGSTS